MRNQVFYGLLVMMITALFWGTSSTSSDVIYWTPDYKLSWDDFEGHPNYKHNYKDVSAMTVSGIVDYRGCEDGKIIYKIKSYFEKKHSWVKLSGRNDHTLEHEQVHFDITELYARKLRNELAARSFLCGEEAAFETFVHDFLKGWQEMQQTYDAETEYSNQPARQHEWIQKVRDELKAFEAHKSK